MDKLYTPLKTILEVPGGIEPPMKGFANLYLTIWLRHYGGAGKDSNPTLPSFSADLLPLNYNPMVLRIGIEPIRM